jgi:NhaA family Na+:H+ antiporter
MGVLALVGRRVPPSIRLFLLTVAVVDDLGAVVVIALFYTQGVAWGWLGGALAVRPRCRVQPRGGFADRALWAAGARAVALRAALGRSCHGGGVLAALCVPMKLDAHGDSPLRLEHALVPVNGFFVVPLFGMANAGVELGQMGLEAVFAPCRWRLRAGCSGQAGRRARGRSGGRPAGHRPAPQGRRPASYLGHGAAVRDRLSR